MSNVKGQRSKAASKRERAKLVSTSECEQARDEVSKSKDNGKCLRSKVKGKIGFLSKTEVFLCCWVGSTKCGDDGGVRHGSSLMMADSDSIA